MSKTETPWTVLPDGLRFRPVHPGRVAELRLASDPADEGRHRQAAEELLARHLTGLDEALAGRCGDYVRLLATLHATRQRLRQTTARRAEIDLELDRAGRQGGPDLGACLANLAEEGRGLASHEWRLRSEADALADRLAVVRGRAEDAAQAEAGRFLGQARAALASERAELLARLAARLAGDLDRLAAISEAEELCRLPQSAGQEALRRLVAREQAEPAGAVA